MSDSIQIAHISDLHFHADDGDLDPAEALEMFADQVARLGYRQENVVLVISGDVTTKGRTGGFSSAVRNVRDKVLKRGLFSQIIVCPGNHDISVSRRKFHEFNDFAFAVTNDEKQLFTEDSSVVVTKFRDFDFVAINSAHHGDHRFGSINLHQVHRALSTCGPKTILVTHHSPISSRYGGHGLEHSHELLTLASQHGALALLHGDIHSDQVLTVGRTRTKILGVGSLGFVPGSNMNNQFTVYNISETNFSGVLFIYKKNRNDFVPTELQVP
ncbi:metallophosphoesterase [Gordonia sp. 'Campus']|uniref:metallophosphoesterase family protein n=1 Tax=Gordonia sp. 'Campus' TaxID=2915824 RepID=UPI001EE44C40|nr:metallophosphoesterase [Gordonia sp. 'Campus']